MNILVVDVAASESGALTILKQYYEDLSNDKSNHYYFCVSTPKLNDKDNITILSFPWVKKSWLHRLWFDYVVSGKLLKKHKIDQIFSLQNTVLPYTNIDQIVYLHQPLPFVEYKYRLSEDKRMWCYQNVISRFISHSIKRAKQIIVQTQWMKNAVITKENISPDKIVLDPPKINVVIKNKFCSHNWTGDFFYPASNLIYKNHFIILKALVILKEKGEHVPKVIFTLSEEQLTQNCKELYEKVKVYVRLIGSVSHSEVLDYYSKTVMIFPSYIETFGLPLLESKMVGSPVIASDCAFCHEILDEYEKVTFFNPFDAKKLANIINNMNVEK